MADDKQHPQDWDEVIEEKKYGRPTARAQDWDDVQDLKDAEDADTSASAVSAEANGQKSGLLGRVLGALRPRRKG